MIVCLGSGVVGEGVVAILAVRNECDDGWRGNESVCSFENKLFHAAFAILNLCAGE
jgi:hypothetical protein